MSLKSFIIYGFIFLMSTDVFAWGNDGHSSVGYIAEKNLSADAQAMIQDLIGVEPLAVAAIWADQVRDDPRFKSFAPYHFFEIPISFTTQTLPENLMANRDARTLILQAPEKILNSTTSRQEKIIWLRYLIHVVGDVHQPLHVGNGVDLGANLCQVKWERPTGHRIEQVNLHSLWDTRLLTAVTEDYVKKNPSLAHVSLDYKDISEMIIKEYANKITMASAAKATQDEWIDEGRSYHPQVYPDAKPVKNPADRPYCRIVDKNTNKVVDGKFSASKIPTISKSYILRALPIVKSQLLLAGYRLANLLNSMGAKYTPSAPPLGKDWDISSVLLLNKVRTPQSEKEFQWRTQLPYPDEESE